MHVLTRCREENIGLTFYPEVEEYMTQYKRMPNKLRQIPSLALKMTVDGKDYMHYCSNATNTLDVVVMVIDCLKKHLPQHKILKEWRESKGVIKVNMSEDDIENCNELLHVALRKCSDTEQSAILWQSIHYLNPQAWGKIIEVTQTKLRELEKSRYTRYRLGITVRDAWKAGAEKATYDMDILKSSTEAEKYALLMFKMGCELTTEEDWIWGVSYYMGTDVAND